MAKTKIKTDNKFDVNDGTCYKLWSECGCGCGQVVRNMFAQGHDRRVVGKNKEAK